MSKVLLFDLDGTLIDSLDLILSSYRYTMRVHRDRELPDATWIAELGKPLVAVFAPHAESADETRAMVATYREHNAREHAARLREFPDVHEAISELRRKGATLGIVTSKMRDAALRGLATCRLDGYFDAVVCADDVAVHKPDPAPVLRALELLGAAPSEARFIGDSPHDIEAGRRAGVETVAVGWGPFARTALEAAGPDRWLAHPRDIADLA